MRSIGVALASVSIFVSTDQSTMDVEADAAELEDDDVRAGLDLRGVGEGAAAGVDAAARVAGLLERRVLAGLRERDLRELAVVRERLAARGLAGGATHCPLGSGPGSA